jgi:hypothetical protein
MTTQHYLSETANGHCMGGFNSRLYGESCLQTVDGVPQGYIWGQRILGWELADGMIREGKIFSDVKIDGKTIRFKCYKDGNQWCCVGDGFEDLQESSNYAFGETRDAAIKNFATLDKAIKNTGA